MKVGNKLWYVRNDGRFGVEVEVIKVGRKWATLSAPFLKADIETLAAFSGNYNCGQCYESESAFRQVKRHNRLTSAFKRAVSQGGHIWSCEQIEQAAAILGIALPGDES